MKVSEVLTFSVVIPLYNKPKSIGRAIDSVLNQTIPNFEVIVVDDGSTDSSAAVVKEYQDKRITLVTQENRGVGEARNTGVHHSKGEYVCFLDADDEWNSLFLERIAGLIVENRDAVMYTVRHCIIDGNGRTRLGALSLRSDHRGVVDDFIEVYRRSPSLVNSSSVCVRREAFAEAGGFPIGQPVGEDVLLWIKIALLGRVMFDARVSSVAHHNAENRTSTREEATIPYFLSYFLDGEDGKIYLKTHASLRKFVAHYAMIYSAEAVRRGKRRQAIWYARQLWSNDKLIAITCFLFGLVPKWGVTAAKEIRAKLATLRWKRLPVRPEWQDL